MFGRPTARGWSDEMLESLSAIGVDLHRHSVSSYMTPLQRLLGGSDHPFILKAIGNAW